MAGVGAMRETERRTAILAERSRRYDVALRYDVTALLNLVVRKLTSEPDRVTLTASYIANDLPTGAPRLRQRSQGYRTTFVAGRCIQRDGEDMGARPGRLVRAHPGV